MPHQPGRFDLSRRVQNFRFGQPLLFGNRRKNILQLLIKNNILNKNITDLNSPFMDMLWHEFANLQSYLIPLFQQILKHILSAYRSNSRKSQLLHWFWQITYRIKHFSWNFNVVVNGCVDVNFDVVSREGFLPIQVYYACLHVDHVNFISEWIKILQAWAHSFYVSAESFINALLKDMSTYKTLVDLLIRVLDTETRNEQTAISAAIP